MPRCWKNSGGSLNGLRVVRIAHERDRAAAEVQRAAVVVEHDFHAGRIGELFGRRHRRGERRHAGRRVLFQQLDHAVDVVGRHLRLVALHVDQDLGLRQLAGDFGHAVGAARAVGARHHEVAAEPLDLAGDLGMVGGDDHAGRLARGAGRFVRVLQKCLAGFAQQHLPRQPRRGVAGGDDDIASRLASCGSRSGHV